MKKHATVAAYLKAQPPKTRKALTQVRAAIRKALPKAEEGMSYGIPVYKLEDRVVIFFAGWKEHFSLYPILDVEKTRYADEIGDRAVSKGTLRFSLDEKVPVGLIAKLAKLRAKRTLQRLRTQA